MNFKTILGWLAVAFVVWWVILHPHGAAQIVTSIGDWMTSAPHGLSNFFSSI